MREKTSNSNNIKRIKLFRRVKVGFNSTKEQEINTHSASRSAMESVEIKAGNEQLPTRFLFSTVAYEGIKAINFECQLRTSSNEKEVCFKYRICQLDATKEPPITRRFFYDWRNPCKRKSTQFSNGANAEPRTSSPTTPCATITA